MPSATSSAVPLSAVIAIFIVAYFLLRRSRKRDDDWLTRDRHGSNYERIVEREQPGKLNWHPGRDYDLTMKEWLEINSRRDV